jgi:hypothetical protein
VSSSTYEDTDYTNSYSDDSPETFEDPTSLYDGTTDEGTDSSDETPNYTYDEFSEDSEYGSDYNYDGYYNVDGNYVPSPNYSGETMGGYSPSFVCNDGTYSYAQHSQGACSYHGGISY